MRIRIGDRILTIDLKPQQSKVPTGSDLRRKQKQISIFALRRIYKKLQALRREIPDWKTWDEQIADLEDSLLWLETLLVESNTLRETPDAGRPPESNILFNEEQFAARYPEAYARVAQRKLSRRPTRMEVAAELILSAKQFGRYLEKYGRTFPPEQADE